MKILITGARGQLGRELVELISLMKESYEVIAMSSSDLDITNSSLVSQMIFNMEPQVIINCAAYTKVDDCEINQDIALKVNTLGARNLAIAAENINAKLVHISTDYIFNGEGSVALREYDLVGPTSVYGKTKLMGDKYVRDFATKYFIIRISWAYGKYGNNFVYTIIKAGKERGELRVVNDQIGNPTNTKDLAQHILKLIKTEEYGIYNCTGSGECTWYDFACKIIEYSGINCNVTPVTSEEFKTVAKRPAYSSLDNMMLRSSIGDKMRPWEESLKEFIKDIN